jgi:alanyl-tRNA synthetase
LETKKSLFWEMGGIRTLRTCSEIHIDLLYWWRRAAVSGKALVNADHPQVVEIWNIFMEFSKADGSMKSTSSARRYRNGFERLCMAMQKLLQTMIRMCLHHLSKSGGNYRIEIYT